jgi:hypothetical protein
MKTGNQSVNIGGGRQGMSGISGYSGYSGATGAGTSGYSGYSGMNGSASASGFSGYSGYSGYFGADAVFGGDSQLYSFDTSTSVNPPAGDIRFNNADPTLATLMYISITNNTNVDVSVWLSALSDSSSPIRGRIRLFSEFDYGNFYTYNITGAVVNNTTYFTVPIGFVVGDGVFSLNELIVISFSATGNSGYSGYSGASGYIGVDGASGYSGYSGKSGYSGYSGASGYIGVDGASGYSGYSGYSGASGISGYSGYSGISGYSGYSGISGYSGYSGISGYSGYSGYSGTNGVVPIVTATGTVDAITATYSPAVTLADKTLVAFVASGANLTTTPTFAPNGLTAHVITQGGGLALRAGDISSATYVCLVEYNLANTRWELLNPAKITLSDFATVVANANKYIGYDASGVPALFSNTGINGVTYDGNGGVISVNNYAEVVMPCNGTITGWIISSINPADGTALSGSIVIDIKRSGTSIIGGGNAPTLSSQSSANASANGSWTSLTFSANDRLAFYVVSATTVVKVECIITYNKTT